MRKVISKIPQLNFESIFSRKKKAPVKAASSCATSDQEKLRKSAQKTLKKYKKTFRKLAFE